MREALTAREQADERRRHDAATFGLRDNPPDPLVVTLLAFLALLVGRYVCQTVRTRRVGGL